MDAVTNWPEFGLCSDFFIVCPAERPTLTDFHLAAVNTFALLCVMLAAGSNADVRALVVAIVGLNRLASVPGCVLMFGEDFSSRAIVTDMDNDACRLRWRSDF